MFTPEETDELLTMLRLLCWDNGRPSLSARIEEIRAQVHARRPQPAGPTTEEINAVASRNWENMRRTSPTAEADKRERLINYLRSEGYSIGEANRLAHVVHICARQL